MLGLGPFSSLSSSCCSLASEASNWEGPVLGRLALAACLAEPCCEGTASPCRDVAMRCLSKACGKPSEGLLPRAYPFGRLHAAENDESVSSTLKRCVAVCKHAKE